MREQNIEVVTRLTALTFFYARPFGAVGSAYEKPHSSHQDAVSVDPSIFSLRDGEGKGSCAPCADNIAYRPPPSHCR
jgi:hypothetical protein